MSDASYPVFHRTTLPNGIRVVERAHPLRPLDRRRRVARRRQPRRGPAGQRDLALHRAHGVQGDAPPPDPPHRAADGGGRRLPQCVHVEGVHLLLRPRPRRAPRTRARRRARPRREPDAAGAGGGEGEGGRRRGDEDVRGRARGPHLRQVRGRALPAPRARPPRSRRARDRALVHARAALRLHRGPLRAEPARRRRRGECGPRDGRAPRSPHDGRPRARSATDRAGLREWLRRRGALRAPADPAGAPRRRHAEPRPQRRRAGPC